MMPWWRLLVAVMALLFLLPLVSTKDTPSAPSTPPPKIDLNNTIPGDAYFIRESCATKKATGDEMLTSEFTRVDLQCNVILRTRKRGDKKLLIEIDIEHMSWMSVSKELDPTKSIKIQQADFTIECKPDGNITTVCTAPKDSKWCEELSIDKKFIPPITYFKEDRIFCSFIMKSSTPTLASKFSGISQNPKLIYTAKDQSSKTLVYGYQNIDFWNKGTAQCDPDLIKTRPLIKQIAATLHPIKDITAKDIKCDEGRLFIMTPNENDITVDSLSCTDYWKHETNSKPKTLNEAFTVMCKIKFCAQCKAPPLLECPSCYKPNVTQVGDECATITCPSNRWILEVDGRQKWADNPTLQCDRFTTKDTLYYAWKLHSLRGLEWTEVTKASCTEEYDCLVHSDIKLECTSDESPCRVPNYEKGIISCGGRGYKLKLQERPDFVPRSITCDSATGLLSYNSIPVGRGVTIACYATREYNKERMSKQTAGPATGSVDSALIASLAVAGLLILIGIPIGIFFWMKRRNSTPPPDTTRVKVAPSVTSKEGKAAQGGNHWRRMKTIKGEVDDEENGRKKSRNSNSSSGTSKSGASGVSKKLNKSSESVHSNTSKKSNKWPKGFRRRVFNPNRVIPKMDSGEISSKNAYPCPRFAANCPDEYSTSMDIQNPRLVELAAREKATTTVSKSVQKKDGDGKGASTSQASIEEKTA